MTEPTTDTNNKIVSFCFLTIFVVCIILDQLSKIYFSTRHLVKNFGLSFSLNFGPVGNSVLVIIALIFFLYYLVTHRRQFTFFQLVGATLILAGAASNILDRAYFGYVRDLFDIGLGFTFNLADVFVVVGLIALFLF